MSKLLAVFCPLMKGTPANERLTSPNEAAFHARLTASFCSQLKRRALGTGGLLEMCNALFGGCAAEREGEGKRDSLQGREAKRVQK